jgi:predicted DCC family thiol-disulfide oxidoreductase YuxK
MDTAAKPVLVFDGKCSFCRIWIDYSKHLVPGAVEYAPSQEVAADFPQIPPEDFKKAVQLILPSGEVFSGAHAVFKTLAYNPSYRWLLSMYRRVPGLAKLAEFAYRVIAANRNFFYSATVLLFGRTVQPLRFDAVQWLFQKLLAIVWFIAFVSFGVQAPGLIGSHGVQPVGLYLARLSQVLGGNAWLSAPTLFWIKSGDAVVQGVCIAGAVFALLAVFGVFWRVAFFLAFILYLSLVNASQEFLSYQWDYLLLEAGFLAIFLGYSRAIIWLFRWLLFRLMFLSGAVKLLSGDTTWHGLTALLVHYQTQPIPTPLAWYAHQLPVWFQKFSCFAVLFIELVISILVLGPRRIRLFAAPWLIGLQVLILLTGNYAFFNWIAIGLCVFLVDDAWLARFLPRSWIARAANTSVGFVPVRFRLRVAWSVGIVIAILSCSIVAQSIFGDLPDSARALVAFAAPFGISSSYGLFANMTTTRPEIVIEGSNDGAIWLEYEFKYKPGRLDRPPPWVAPHQPRLDWQMWFAALGTYRENVWFLNTLARLLQGTPEVLRLIERNPFPDRPPKLLRAQMYEYRFTEWRTRRETGKWWTRTPLGLYVPSVSLENLSPLPIIKQAQ